MTSPSVSLSLSHTHTHTRAVFCYLRTSIYARKLVYADKPTSWFYQSPQLLMTSLRVIILITVRATPVNWRAEAKGELDTDRTERKRAWRERPTNEGVGEWSEWGNGRKGGGKERGRGQENRVRERKRGRGRETKTGSREREEAWSIVHFTKSLRRVSSVNKWINLSVGLWSMTPYHSAPPRPAGPLTLALTHTHTHTESYKAIQYKDHPQISENRYADTKTFFI